MGRTAKIRQIWECPVCGFRYESPLAVTEARCPKPHTSRELAVVEGRSQKTSGRSGLALMKLIEGEPK